MTAIAYLCKAITIILIVLGNVAGVPHFLRTIVYSFHIPLLMVIEGYLIPEINIRNELTRSVKGLLKPYIGICVLEGSCGAFLAANINQADILMLNENQTIQLTILVRMIYIVAVVMVFSAVGSCRKRSRRKEGLNGSA